MRFLADMGVSIQTARSLRDAGHDLVHLREIGQERLPDAGILALARHQQRIVITFDLDFGDLLAAGGFDLPSVIIFRLHNHLPAEVTHRLLDIIGEQELALAAGALIMVEEGRYRLRRLPIV
jgi:predicted nuclease of predicted toxin-antitoxin system